MSTIAYLEALKLMESVFIQWKPPQNFMFSCIFQWINSWIVIVIGWKKLYSHLKRGWTPCGRAKLFFDSLRSGSRIYFALSKNFDNLVSCIFLKTFLVDILTAVQPPNLNFDAPLKHSLLIITPQFNIIY